METLFRILSFAPGPFWLMILFWPTHRKAMLAVDVFLILLATHFTILSIPALPELFPVIASPSLDAIQGFFSTPQGTVGAWNHMILSDLWIGRWVAHDSIKDRHAQAVRLIFILPILFFGPLGLFLYLIYRIGYKRKLKLT